MKRYFAPHLFQGQTVFVTGGAGTINRVIARGFASLGARVAICGRTVERLEEAAAFIREEGGPVAWYRADVEDIKSLEEALRRTREELGPVDVLVCGAAGNFPCPAEQMSAAGFAKVVSIDLLGSFNAARAAFGQLRDTRGNVIFVSATNAIMPFAFQSHVGAAKAGIDQLMRGLALEWGKHGIRCNSVLPGPIEQTEGLSRLLTAEDIEMLKGYVPLGRFGTVEEVAKVTLFLASPIASLITGASIIADGGQWFAGSAMLAEFLTSR